MGYHEYKTCIDACLQCAAICNHCSSSSLQEENVDHMRNCIQLCMECAAICYASAQLMSLDSRRAKDICDLCAKICNACAEECSGHDNKHCQECSEMCRRCALECSSMS